MHLIPDATEAPASTPAEGRSEPTVERVAFATDGGPAGSGALAWIARRATRGGLHIGVDLVLEQDWVSGGLHLGDAEKAADAVVEAAVTYLRQEAPAAEIHGNVTWADPRERFEQLSAAADLLVVGTNRTGQLAGPLGGGFAMKLAEAARCPAIVVPRSWRPGEGPVVVGVQGDASDEGPLGFAAREARASGRTLRVVHTWRLPTLLASEALLVPPVSEIARSHDQLLRSIVDPLRAANADLRIESLSLEGPAAALLAEQGAGAELLVVGSHRLGFLDRYFVGSTSRTVLSRPPCPVAIVGMPVESHE
ncbi:MAG: hypothetical protein JWR33_1235 [Naasia sp.]|jgi:nucleotide-binding universal stress UspA family protein|uniref:universal stress protein n=1 Tax=Naasia sp. TaxID=2546198 RepID=UPI002604AE43|nr:universal stress protein [Naasia sp.]MCU1570494.1 hypothetical protein [Naasia sp.]